MADNRQDFSTDRLGRQEEEVRDLFRLLTENEPDQPKTVSEPQQPVASVWAIEVSPAEEPQEEEQQEAQEKPCAELAGQEEPMQVIEEEPQSVVEQEPLMQEPTKEEPMAQEQPSEQAESPFHAIQETENDEDEEDMYAELPPLILTSYDDDWYDEEDEDFAQNDVEHFRLPENNGDYEVDEAPTVRRNPLLAFWCALRSNVPLPCDSKREIGRKSVFWTSVLVLVFALTYILYSVWWLPAFTKNMYNGVEQDYHPELQGIVEDSGMYPGKMQLSFQALYDRNPETRGWLSFHAAGNRDFLNIEYPVMYSGDNDKYLTIDFNGNKNKNGTLFFDMRANLSSAEDTNTTLIVYGHNMASGQMLAGLNKFIGNVNNARVAPTLTMNTLFTNGQYKVFAVIITDESAPKEQYYNIRRTQFNSDEDFLNHIDNLRARSLFDYPVDVLAGDELLMLSTCTVPSSAKIRDGRLTVVARKVRADESVTVDTARITKNDDVIMPYAWYTLQKKAPHAYYANGQLSVPSVNTTTGTSTTFSNDGTLTTTDSSSTETTVEGNAGTTTIKLHSSGSTTQATAAPSASKTTSSPALSPSSTVSATTTASTSTTASTGAADDNTTTAAEETTTTITEEATTTEETTTTTVAESE